MISKKSKQSLEKRIITLWESQYLKKEYAPLWYKKLQKYSPSREDLACKFALNYKGKILDIGCGEGDLLIKLADKYTQLNGIDILNYRISKGNKKIQKQKIKNVKLQVANIENGLPFSAKTFDVIICLSVLQYVFDPYFAIKQINRLLKPGGVLLINVPNVGYVLERFKVLFGKLPNNLPSNGWQGGNLHNFTKSTVGIMLKENGFRVDNVVGSGFLHEIRSFWPSLLTGDLMFVCIKK